MFRPSSNTFNKINEIIECTPRNELNLILLVHEASGCDALSALSGIGKTKLNKMLEKGLVEGTHLHVFSTTMNKADSTINSLKEQRL